MLAVYHLFEQNTQKLEKVVVTKNYIVQDYENPPQEFIEKYRRKEIIDKDGNRHLATFAILNKEGEKAKGVKTVMTSMWHPKDEEKARLRGLMKEAPEVKIKTKEISSEQEM